MKVAKSEYEIKVNLLEAEWWWGKVRQVFKKVKYMVSFIQVE